MVELPTTIVQIGEAAFSGENFSQANIFYSKFLYHKNIKIQWFAQTVSHNRKCKMCVCIFVFFSALRNNTQKFLVTTVCNKREHKTSFY